MSLDTYANFKTAIADHLARDDLASQITDCITLFESEAALELFRERRSIGSIVYPPLGSESTVTAQGTLATITGASANSVNGIRLTVNDTSYLGSPGDTFEYLIRNVEGTTEANGRWLVTISDGVTVDLENSTFVNAYTSGGEIADYHGPFLQIPSDYLGWISVTWLGSPPRQLQYVGNDVFNSEFAFADTNLTTGTPSIFTIEGSALLIKPFDFSTHVELVYYKKTESLASSLNWLFTEQVDCYWNGVLEQIYEYLKDYEQAAHYGAAKQKSFDEIKMERFREGTNLAIRVAGSNFGATP